MELYNTRRVFLDSANNVRGNGEQATWMINNIDDFSALGGDKMMKCSLSSFSMFKNFYNINETNSIFYADQSGTYTEIIIPKGDYDGFTAATGILNPLDAAIQAALVAAGFVGATVTFDTLHRGFDIDMSAVSGWTNGTDKFRCFIHKNGTPPTNVSAEGWFNDFWMILGARPDRDNVGLYLVADAFDYDSGTGLYSSPYTAQLSSLDEIVIRTDMPSMNYQSSGYDRTQDYNFALDLTNILARIPINRSTYDPDIGMIHFTDEGADTFSLMMGNSQLSQFSLYLTDGRGRFIQEISTNQAKNGALSFRATLRFDYLFFPQQQNQVILTPDRMQLYPQNIGRG